MSCLFVRSSQTGVSTVAFLPSNPFQNRRCSLVSPLFYSFHSHKKPTIQADFISFFGARAHTVYFEFPTVQKCNVRFKLILITQQKAEYYCLLLVEDGLHWEGAALPLFSIAYRMSWQLRNSVDNFAAVIWNLKDYNRKTLTKRIKPFPCSHPSNSKAKCNIRFS